MMGWAKERAYQEETQGWRYSEDLLVCSTCLADAELARRLTQFTSTNNDPCSFCNRVPAAEFDELMSIVTEALMREWGDPNDVGIFWDGREGGWQGVDVLDTDDILDEHRDAFVSEDVWQAVVDAIGLGREWVRREVARLTPYQSLRFSWEEFRRAVMHKTRFVFWTRVAASSDDDSDGEVMPASVLDEVLAMVGKYEMARVIPKGNFFVRVRLDDAHAVWNAAALGTVPERLAVQSNRMSPSGIPMFYAASDVCTATAEAKMHSSAQLGAVGYFEGSRDVRLIDLTRLPEVPSYFDEDHERRRERASVLFLHSFVRDLREPMGAVPEINYIPTQVVTEYFLKGAEGMGVADGLVYASTTSDGRCYALDVDSEHCVDDSTEISPLRRNDLHMILQRVDAVD